jgi:hypothetical protein
MRLPWARRASPYSFFPVYVNFIHKFRLSFGFCGLFLLTTILSEKAELFTLLYRRNLLLYPNKKYVKVDTMVQYNILHTQLFSNERIALQEYT